MPSLSPATLRHTAKAALVLFLCALTLGFAGCRKRTAQAAPPTVILPPSPEPTAPAKRAETKPEPVPSTNSTPAPPPAIVVPRPKPVPNKPKPDPDTQDPAPPKTVPPPQISPRLSPEEQASAEQHTSEDLGQAEKNMQAASGRQLNAAQQDLAEKARGFVGQAREAMRSGDWVRARNLAQKARVLSAELVNSL
jgi:outer membrane biosynthesis protein TonB